MRMQVLFKLAKDFLRLLYDSAMTNQLTSQTDGFTDRSTNRWKDEGTVGQSHRWTDKEFRRTLELIKA